MTHTECIVLSYYYSDHVISVDYKEKQFKSKENSFAFFYLKI